jgi:hypothetical protein
VIKLGKLKAARAEMTPGEWRWDDEHREITAGTRTEDYGMGPEVRRNIIVETDSGHYPPHGGDRTGIPACVNAIDEAIEVIEAALELRSMQDDLIRFGDGDAWGATALDKAMTIADGRLRAALAKVQP